MAVMEKDPLSRHENKSHVRTVKILRAIRGMRGGGTVTDVRDIANLMLDSAISSMTVRRHLWFLIDLGLVSEEQNQSDNSRWYEAISPEVCDVA